MTEVTPSAVEPMRPAHSLRRRLIVALVAGLAAAVGAYLGLQLLVHVLPTAVSSAQTPTPTATESGESATPEVYVSEAGAFSVEIGYEPQVFESASAAFGPEYRKVQSSWAVGTREYYIQMVEFPEDYDEPTDSILTNSVSGMLASTTGATLGENDRVTFKGETAAVGVIDVPSGPARFVVVLHNYRQYLIVAQMADDSSDEDFLASFTFLD